MNEMNSKYKFEDIEIIFIKGKKSQKKKCFYWFARPVCSTILIWE